ncbi:uncharacterized protein [Saccopteryx leptura]|uniref:uncharacterized protein isoform X3 n=1 Tax=Saccopteryx leptura TaxID=249018 RepID=UPI00339BC347
MDVRMSLQNPAFNIFVSTSGNEIAGPYVLYRLRRAQFNSKLGLFWQRQHFLLCVGKIMLSFELQDVLQPSFQLSLMPTSLLLTGQKTTVRILLPALCSHSYPTLELGKSPLNGSMDLLRPKKDQSTWATECIQSHILEPVIPSQDKKDFADVMKLRLLKSRKMSWIILNRITVSL